MSRPCNPLSDYPCDIDRATGACVYCGWTECAMACGTLVPDLNTRCADCHPLGCPCPDCRDCECSTCVAAGLVEDDSDGVPEEVEEEETVKETTLTDQQLLALVDTMVECREAA